MTRDMIKPLTCAGHVRCTCGSTDVQVIDEPDNRKRFCTCRGCGLRVVYTYGHDVPLAERRHVLREGKP